MAPEPGPGTQVGSIPAVHIDRLTKRLRNGIVAVDNLSLAIEPGQVLGMVGPNGSGKTITLRILLGLVRPTSGRVLLFGQDVRPGAPVLGRVGGLVDGPGFVPYLSGRRNLELICRQISGAGGAPDLEGAIGMADLGEAIDRSFSSYSHGMRYRLALAQALLGEPDLLLLDEPTTGMDPVQIQEVHAAIAACAESGKTIVLSSHQLSEVELVCTHAAVLRSGRLMATGPVAELIGARPRVRFDVDDPDSAIALLRRQPGVSVALASGPGSVTVEGEMLSPLALLEALHTAGVTVSGYRSTNFEDSYLDLFRVDPGQIDATGINRN